MISLPFINVETISVPKYIIYANTNEFIALDLIIIVHATTQHTIIRLSIFIPNKNSTASTSKKIGLNKNPKIKYESIFLILTLYINIYFQMILK